MCISFEILPQINEVRVPALPRELQKNPCHVMYAWQITRYDTYTVLQTSKYFLPESLQRLPRVIEISLTTVLYTQKAFPTSNYLYIKI